jgi:hypothetical protein
VASAGLAREARGILKRIDSRDVGRCPFVRTQFCGREPVNFSVPCEHGCAGEQLAGRPGEHNDTEAVLERCRGGQLARDGLIPELLGDLPCERIEGNLPHARRPSMGSSRDQRRRLQVRNNFPAGCADTVNVRTATRGVTPHRKQTNAVATRVL